MEWTNQACFIIFKVFAYTVDELVKDALSGLREFLASESPLKMMKNAFYVFNGYLYFPPPGPGPGPQFLFTGPGAQFVFTGPGPQFVFNTPGLKFVFTGPGPKFVFSSPGPKFVFTGPGL